MAPSIPTPGNATRPPGFPNDPQPIVFDGFETLNTKPSRAALQPQEMYICDGFMPLGKSNLRTLYGIGPALYTAPTGVTIVMFAFGNVKAVSQCFVFLSDGSVIAIVVSTGIASTIAPAGTIQNPSPSTVGLSQWGSQYIIIVSSQTNGYFLWDGTLLYSAGTLGPDIDITSDGLDYTSAPTITAVGGSGSGASFSATLQNGSIESISITNAGSGYTYTDYVTLAFSGGGSAYSTATATAVVSSGTISTISITNAGAGYTTTTSVAIYGGGGSGATATASVSSGTIASISITAAGEGYTSSPTVVITDGNNPVAQAAASLMPFGVQGTAVETYEQHAWVADGAKILFTAAEYASDFSTVDGGGAFTSRDSFLRVGFTSLKQSNGFLYLVADSSLNYISGVQTTGSPATTTFSNLNADPQIGSPWPGSVQVFSRNIALANSFGVHASYGGAVTKVSSQLDGIYATVPGFNGFSPSSAVAVIFGIHVYMLLLPIVDQVTGQPVNKLLMWDGKRWWTASQEVTLTWIATQEIDSDMTAWGTDGDSIYPLFNQPSTMLTKTVQSGLFEVPSYIYTKMANRVFGLVDYNAVSSEPITVEVDDGVSTTPSSFTQAPNTSTWINSSGDPITWTGAGGATLTWGYAGLELFKFSCSQPGPLLGLTFSTNAPDLTLVSLTMVEQVYQTGL